jgi:hypothetical protein
MNAIENSIDLIIGSGLFLAPRRVLLEKSADLKQHSQRIDSAGAAEEVEHKVA